MNDKDVNILFWTNALKGKIGQDNKKNTRNFRKGEGKKSLTNSHLMSWTKFTTSPLSVL